MKFTSGLPETACGLGSTLSVAAHFADALPSLLKRLGIEKLLDAPCGDANWLSTVDLAGVRYIGVDASAYNIATAEEKAPELHFRIADILSDALPKADAVLSRDFLQHLPMTDVFRALNAFKRTGARFLIATSFDCDRNDDIAERGNFRPLNLETDPVNLGSPVERIPDPPGSARIMGVWILNA